MYAFYDCPKLTDIYYSGTEEQWNQIYIDEGNEYLTNANIHYFIFGDVNGDDMVNVKDASDIQKYIAGAVMPVDLDEAKGDVNNDGVLNVVDVTEIQKYLAGMVSCFDNQ